MSRLIMLIAIAVVGGLIYKLYFKNLRQQGKPGMIKLGLIALGLVFMVMAVTGRAHILFALIGAAMTQVVRLMPLVIRFLPMFQQALNSRKVFTPNSGQQSKVRTAILVMTLDHDTGHIDGDVVTGSLSGRTLGSLSLPELRALYSECQHTDPEGVRLLQAYASRVHEDAWEEPEGTLGGNNPGDSSRSSVGAVPDVTEAYEILGLAPDADKTAVIAAHKSLMGKMHPDKGGSNYLAAKINAAKEVLVNHLT